MVSQLSDNLYTIPVPLPGNPLRELNSYFLRGQERDLLIDTGFRRPECRAALEAAKRASTSAPPRYASDETIAERKAGTSAETPRIKKTFKTPTSLD